MGAGKVSENRCGKMVWGLETVVEKMVWFVYFVCLWFISAHDFFSQNSHRIFTELSQSFHRNFTLLTRQFHRIFTWYSQGFPLGVIRFLGTAFKIVFKHVPELLHAPKVTDLLPPMGLWSPMAA